MRLRLKKRTAYVWWPILWVALSLWTYVAALKPAWRKYRWHVQEAWDLPTLRRGFAWIDNYTDTGPQEEPRG